jgi:hypothetical protein
LVGDEVEIVLDCYRLARHYHQNPAVFLDMPLSEVRLHLRRTIELAEVMQKYADSDDG